MKKVYVNEAVCMGCGLCEINCRLAHSPVKDIIKAYKDSPPAARLRVERQGTVSFSVSCRNCDEPPCVYACLTGALKKEASGMVVQDSERCVGCWTCILACPYGAIRQDKLKGLSVKCDLCAGEEMPACVAGCPNEALVYAESGETAPDSILSGGKR
jgi:carbon-monoxide dehydrogenase iron sulfur subunit